LFRIADTIEDGDRLNRDEKLAALDNFASLLRDGLLARRANLDLPRSPSSNPHYRALLGELPLVVHSLGWLPNATRTVVLESLLTSLAGMQRFVGAGTADGHIQVKSVNELREYCFLVAGVVGEMLTELFVEAASSLTGVRDQLRAHAHWFGEGLQLVNILKDSDEDRRDGRVFVPAAATRDDLFQLARADLHKAEDYVLALKQADAPAGFIAFTELPLSLAWRTLECVEQFGPGSKVPRSEVRSILARTHAGVAQGRSTTRITRALAK
jgi:farnesyl-diphosphate farnesyltransferase